MNVKKSCRERLKVVEGVKWVDDEEVFTEELKNLDLEEDHVPVIDHDGEIFDGFKDIVEYLEDAFRP